MRNKYEQGFWDRLANRMERPISRRELMGATVAAVGVMAVGGVIVDLLGSTQKTPSDGPDLLLEDPILQPISQEENYWKGPEMFADANANAIARSYGINVGTFFIAPKEIIDKLDAHLDDNLFPVYPAAVMKQSGLIYRLADKFSVPPNIIATIMSIESAGNVGIPSSVGAQGLFQVMPDKFSAELRKDPAKMIDPDINGDVGINYFVKFCLPTARAELVSKGYSLNNPSVYARALMGYNGGPGTISLSFQNPNLYDETRFYGDHFIRYPLISQIAKGLREKGYSDEQIVKALTLNSAVELDARAAAMQDFDIQERKTNGYDYWQYRAVSRLLARPIPDVEDGIETILMSDLEDLPDREYQVKREREYMKEVFPRIKSSYAKYKAEPYYKVPLSIAMRMWSSLGGLSLLQRAPENMNPDAYYHAEIKRKR